MPTIRWVASESQRVRLLLSRALYGKLVPAPPMKKGSFRSSAASSIRGRPFYIYPGILTDFAPDGRRVPKPGVQKIGWGIAVIANEDIARKVKQVLKSLDIDYEAR